MSYSRQTAQLLSAYRSIRTRRGNAPQWSVRKCENKDEGVIATIPFVGKDYENQAVKILVYASAENLTNYRGYLDEDAIAENRHRLFFDASAEKGDSFFPQVHLRPMEDGALATAAAYVYSKLWGLDPVSPASFLEKIAFGNVGKFSRRTENGREHNIDYAGNISFLKDSMDYVSADLAILKPDVILMPATAYQNMKEQMDASGAKVLPIYQINVTTVNTLISRKYPPKNPQELSPTLKDWTQHLAYRFSGKSREHFLSVFTYLDALMDEAGFLAPPKE